MKIAFMGKGGSGKTTLATSFINYSTKLRMVIAVDADQNVHLARALGFDQAPNEMGQHFEGIASYLRGDRADLGDRPMIGTTPPAAGSTLIEPRADDPFMAKWAERRDNLLLLSTGTYTAEDIGHNCYHSKLDSTIAAMSHLNDGPDDLVVVDATAGTDTFGTALYYQYDAIVFVVEPTEKSLRVLLDFIALRGEGQQPIFVIANKIEDEDDLAYVQKTLPVPLLGTAGFSDAVYAADREGTTPNVDHDVLWKQLTDELEDLSRDGDRYNAGVHAVHKLRAARWYNAYYGEDLSADLDTEFRMAPQ